MPSRPAPLAPRHTRHGLTSAVARCLVAGVLAVTVMTAPAGARPTKVARASQSVTDAAGLRVSRTWEIDPADPRTLTVTVVVANPTEAPVSTTHLEPLPTESLERIRFAPRRLDPTVDGGIARIPLELAPRSAGKPVKFTYTARLTRDPKASASERLLTAREEMAAALTAAQPTDADKAGAIVGPLYLGSVTWSEDTATGFTRTQSLVGDVDNVTLLLNPTAVGCMSPGRGCGFQAKDGYTTPPVLTSLRASGIDLVETASSETSDPLSGAFTCAGAGQPTTTTKDWRVVPAAWRLGWEGWKVSEVDYTLTIDFGAPAGRCPAAAGHLVVGGRLLSSAR